MLSKFNLIRLSLKIYIKADLSINSLPRTDFDISYETHSRSRRDILINNIANELLITPDIFKYTRYVPSYMASVYANFSQLWYDDGTKLTNSRYDSFIICCSNKLSNKHNNELINDIYRNRDYWPEGSDVNTYVRHMNRIRGHRKFFVGISDYDKQW